PWPGNVRELGAVATRLWLDRPTEISAEHARRALGDASPARAEVTAEARVHAALKTAKGNKSEAARLLGVSRGTLYKRLRELGLEG
ncbi:MAG: AAA family ATPase, partial [Deltaproteobacteria bacterium]|nr:AAA family ATPase [Deltaproteobacteria bacterium]